MVIFYKTWKKCHEIQFKKMDLNKWKMRNIKAWLELEPNFPGVPMTLLSINNFYVKLVFPDTINSNLDCDVYLVKNQCSVMKTVQTMAT